MTRLSNADQHQVSQAMRILGSIKSKAKAKSSKANAKLGGWPKGKKRRPEGV